MNQKNSLGLNKCFLDLDDPFQLFEEWFEVAKKKEINDPNALALGTASKDGVPSVRMVLLKGFDKDGFIFYTNLKSQKSKELKENPNATMCFHWKSLQRQIRIVGVASKVSKKDVNQLQARTECNRVVNFDFQNINILGKLVDIDITKAYQRSLTGKILNSKGVS
mgnify:CR=1 FL=1